MSSKLAKYLVLSLFFISGGCIEEIVMDPGERAVVVECIIDNEDKLQTVHLSYSASVSDNDYPKVEEADVRMRFVLDTHYTDFEDGHTVIIDTSGSYEFVKAADGVWQTEFEPIEYAQYTLEVEVPGYGTITAETVFPPKMKVSNSVEHSYIINEFGIERKIWIYGLDYNPSTMQYEIADYIYSSDRYVDNFNLTEVTKDDIEEFRWPEGLRLEDIGDPPDYTTPGYCLFWWGRDWSPYLLPVINSKSYILWSEQDGVNLMLYRDSQISPWPNDYGYNFHDRYLRWEYHGLEYTGTIYKKYDPQNYYIIEERKLLEGETSSMWIVVNFKPYRYYVPHPLSHLVFDSVSDDLDKYYKDVLTFEQMQQQPFTDLTELWDRFEIHSNVKGGTGIFGALYRVKASWCVDDDYYNSYIESQGGQ